MAKTTATTKAANRPGENGFKYKPQFGLVLVCKDEKDQQRQFAKFLKLGFFPKVVCV